MANPLVIVESPAKARTIARFLAGDSEFDDAMLEASVGHIRDLPANAAEVFAKFQAQPGADPALPLAFSTAEAGGLAKPDMGIDGLSRMLGPVPNVDAVKNMTFDASVFAGAQLLGGPGEGGRR